VRLIVPVVGLAARRVAEVWGDASSATLHEIVQDVFVKLCADERRVLREFASRDGEEFLRLLRVITARLGRDHFRRLTAEKRGGSLTGVPVEPESVANEVPDGRAARAVEMRSLFAQLDGLLRLYPKQVSARDRKIFWLHFSHGMSPRAISRIATVDLSAAGVESALTRLTRLLRDTVIHGKPGAEAGAIQSSRARKIRAFSPTATIDTIEHG